jgi:hypothetical protein
MGDAALPRTSSGFAGIRRKQMAKQIAIFNKAYENASSDVPDKQLPQSATWGFPDKKQKDIHPTSTVEGADMDNVDRGKDWPEIEELDSLGFKD